MASIPAINMLIAQGSTAITAQSGATLSVSNELAEAIVKNTNFTVQNSGDQDWTLSHEGQITKDTGKHALANGEASLKIKPDSTLEILPGLQSITLSMEQELNETPPGIDEANGWKNYVPLRRSWTVEAEGHYYDPANESVYESLHAARDNGNVLEAEVNLFNLTFAGDLAADGMELEAGTDDNAMYSLSFAGSDTLTKSGTPESTIGSLLDLYFNQSSANVALQHRKNGSVVASSTEWTGSAYINSMEIEIARSEFPTVSAEYQGDGALNRNTTSA